MSKEIKDVEETENSTKFSVSCSPSISPAYSKYGHSLKLQYLL